MLHRNQFISSLFAFTPAVGLCSGMPGFDQLEDDDKHKLMSAAFFDIWMVTTAHI